MDNIRESWVDIQCPIYTGAGPRNHDPNRAIFLVRMGDEPSHEFLGNISFDYVVQTDRGEDTRLVLRAVAFDFNPHRSNILHSIFETYSNVDHRTGRVSLEHQFHRTGCGFGVDWCEFTSVSLAFHCATSSPPDDALHDDGPRLASLEPSADLPP